MNCTKQSFHQNIRLLSAEAKMRTCLRSSWGNASTDEDSEICEATDEAPMSTAAGSKFLAALDRWLMLTTGMFTYKSISSEQTTERKHELQSNKGHQMSCRKHLDDVCFCACCLWCCIWKTSIKKWHTHILLYAYLYVQYTMQLYYIQQWEYNSGTLPTYSNFGYNIFCCC